MNKNQKKILQFLKESNSSNFITQEEIVTATNIQDRTVGTECRKLWKEELLEQDLTQGGKPRYRTTVKGENALDSEKLAISSWLWTKTGVISSIVLGVIGLVIAIIALLK